MEPETQGLGFELTLPLALFLSLSHTHKLFHVVYFLVGKK